MRRTRRLVCLFAALALMLALVPCGQAAGAAVQNYSNGFAVRSDTLRRFTGEFPLNYSGQYLRSVILEPDRLTVRGIAGETENRYLLLTLTTPAGEEVYKAVSPRGAGGEASFTLSLLSAGQYRMNLYRNTQLYQSYSHILELMLDYRNGVWSVISSPVYERNAVEAAEETTLSAEAEAFYRFSSPTIQSENAEIQALAAQITGGTTGAYAKALAIHDWVSGNIYYDYDIFYGRAEYGDASATATLKSRRGVCEGFTNLTVALLRAAGVPAKKVNGYVTGLTDDGTFPAEIVQGTGMSNHTWTEAWIEGRWVVIDTTWDSGNAYTNGRISTSNGCESHRYFDISRELFAMDHASLESPQFGLVRLYINYPRMWTADGWKQMTENSVSVFRKNGWVMAPIGAIVEELGGSSSWYRETGYLDRLTCLIGGHNVQLWPGWKDFYVDGQRFSFDVAPTVVKGYTTVQIAPLFAALGFTATSDGPQDNWQYGRITLAYAA